MRSTCQECGEDHIDDFDYDNDIIDSGMPIQKVWRRCNGCDFVWSELNDNNEWYQWKRKPNDPFWRFHDSDHELKNIGAGW